LRTLLTLLFLPVILGTTPFACAKPAPEAKKNAAKLTDEEKSIVKSRAILENLELLQNFDKFRYFDLFVDGDSKREIPAKPATKKGEGKEK
jgi:hypothetical protein